MTRIDVSLVRARRVRRGAFTLVELLVVVAILCILLSIIAPTLRNLPEFARRLSCATNVRQMIEAGQIWAKNHEGNLPGGQPDWPSRYGGWGLYAVADVGAVKQYPVGSGYDPNTPYGDATHISYFYTPDSGKTNPGQGAWLQHGALAGGKGIDPAVMYCPSWTYPVVQYRRVNPVEWNYTGGPIWPVWDDPNCVPSTLTTYFFTSFHMRCQFENGWRRANMRVDKSYNSVFADCFTDAWSGRALSAGHKDGANVGFLGGNVRYVTNRIIDNSNNTDLFRQYNDTNTYNLNWALQEKVWEDIEK